MKRGVDSNVLIYAHIPALKDHVRVREFMLGQLSTAEATLVTTPGVLHEFVHVVTDPRRFEPPVVMSEALAIARLYLDRSNVEIVSADEPALAETFRLMDRHGLGRKRIADTLLAATLLQHGVTEFITCNPRDFGVFDELRVVDPRG